jgi:radical SAM superfamily enzyme YgiQ (UPF0313 family)
MNKKILLLYPEFPTTYWSYKYILPFIGKKAVMPPLGLLTIAAMIPDHYDLRLIDMNVSSFTAKDLQGIDLVLISSMIVQRDSFQKAVALCNKKNIPVAAGGPYPTSSYEGISGVDYFILNEGEITLPEFFKDYENGKPRRLYQTELKPDITKTKPFRLDLIDVKDYSDMAVQFSRGCPFNCEFCDIIELFGRIPRTKSAAQFIAEIEIIRDSGFRGTIFVVDDNFIGNKINVKILLRTIILWQKTNGFPFTFYTEASINLAQDDELMDLMAEAGFDMVFVGIETPDSETLSKCHKTQNTATDMLESISKIQRKGLEVTAGFIIGFDTDPENIFDLQINFIQKAGIPSAMIGLLTALPNTQLYRRLEKEHRLVGESNGNNTHDLSMNFVPRMPLETIFAGYKYVISELYSPKKYFERALVLIKNVSIKKDVNSKLYWTDVRALIISIFRQTCSRYGFRYLGFLINSIRYNPGSFSLALGLAIMGHHYFKITRNILFADRFAGAMEKAVTSFDQKISLISRETDILYQSQLKRSIEK